MKQLIEVDVPEGFEIHHVFLRSSEPDENYGTESFRLLDSQLGEAVSELLQKAHGLVNDTACASLQSERLAYGVELGNVIDQMALLFTHPPKKVVGEKPIGEIEVLNGKADYPFFYHPAEEKTPDGTHYIYAEDTQPQSNQPVECDKPKDQFDREYEGHLVDELKRAIERIEFLEKENEEIAGLSAEILELKDEISCANAELSAWRRTYQYDEDAQFRHKVSVVNERLKQQLTAANEEIARINEQLEYKTTVIAESDVEIARLRKRERELCHALFACKEHFLEYECGGSNYRKPAVAGIALIEHMLAAQSQSAEGK